MARSRDDVDELDVLLLDALHANPRISFERLGPVLGVSPATVTRRWQRLSESGRAWVSSVPGPRLALFAAVLEVGVVPGRALDVARALAAVPEVISVYATGGEFDLHVLVFAGDMRSLSALLLERLPGVPDIAATRAHVGTRWYSAAHWRLGAIDIQQKRTVTDEDATGDRRQATRDRAFDRLDRALFLALQRDGRARHRDLARELGSSEDVVRRRLDALIRRGMLGFRTDFTRSEGGWPAEFITWLSVPQHQLDSLGAQISDWPQTRICLATVGRANLMVMSQVHRIIDAASILDAVASEAPAATVVDQRLVLCAVKSWGRILDASGHALEVVPVDPWASTERDGRL